MNGIGIARLTAISFLGCLLGCGGDTAGLICPLSEPSRKVCQAVSDFKNSLGDCDVRSIQKWSVNELLTNAFLVVTGRSERVGLLTAVVSEFSDVSYASLEVTRCLAAYRTIASAYSAIQDAFWTDANAPDLAIESWFSELEHFRREIGRCQKEIACSGQDSKLSAYEFEDRILVCRSECEKTYYKIDIKGYMGDSFCKRFPERKSEFLERVRKLIGRYPEWYLGE